MKQNRFAIILMLAWILTTAAVCSIALADDTTTITTIEGLITEQLDASSTTTEQLDPSSTTTEHPDPSSTTEEPDNINNATTIVHNEMPTEDDSKEKAAFDSNQFKFPSTTSCDSNSSCIRYSPFYAPSCTKETCVYFLAYYPLDIDAADIVFHLSASKADFVALGFTDSKIAKSRIDIIACIRDGNNVIVKSYFWPDSSSTTAVQLYAGSDELQLIGGEAAGTGLWCSVKRAMKTDDKRHKDLRLAYTQVYLWGHNNADGTPAFVDETTTVKSWEMSTLSLPLTTKLNSEITVHSEILPSNIDCTSNQLSCIRYEFAAIPSGNCNYKTCSYLLSYMMNVGESQNWPVFLSASDAQYVGLGRTQDKSQWASADIIGCRRLSNNTVVPFHYWVSNPKQAYMRQIVPNGLRMIQGGITDTGLWCSLSTLIHTLDSDFSNLTNPAYMLYMWGQVDEHGDPKHWADGKIEVSEDLVDLTTSGFSHRYVVRSAASASKVAGSVALIVLLSSYISIYH